MESEKRVSIQTVIKYFAYAAIAVEAVFAAFWLFKNIGVIRTDYVAQTYILAADSLVVDDSMGILYALIVKVLGHGAVLQIAQVVLGTLAIYFFATSLFNKNTGLILTGIVGLNPIILQAELAVSPNALTLSCVLMAIYAVGQSKSNEKWTVGFGVFALFAGFLNPDYAYLFLIGGAVYFVVSCIARKKFRVVLLLVIAISFAAPVLVNGAIRDDYAYGRVHRSKEYLMMQRLVWPKLSEYEWLLRGWDAWWGDDTGVEFYTDMLRNADKMPDNLASFANKYENLISVKNFEARYKELAMSALSRGPGYWARDVIRDELLYVLSPASAAYIYLGKKTDTSVTSGLYHMFYQAPGLSKVYFVFASMAALILTVLYLIEAIVTWKSQEKKRGVSLTLSIVGIIVLISLYATCVCVREFDYRNVLFMVIGWPAAVMALTGRREAL